MKINVSIKLKCNHCQVWYHALGAYAKSVYLVLNIRRWLLRPSSGWLEERWVFWQDSQFSVESRLSFFLSSLSSPLLTTEDRNAAWWLSVLNVIRFSIKEEVRNIYVNTFFCKDCIKLHCLALSKTQNSNWISTALMFLRTQFMWLWQWRHQFNT